MKNEWKMVKRQLKDGLKMVSRGWHPGAGLPTGRSLRFLDARDLSQVDQGANRHGLVNVGGDPPVDITSYGSWRLGDTLQTALLKLRSFLK